jgi:hypothetical protein
LTNVKGGEKLSPFSIGALGSPAARCPGRTGAAEVRDAAGHSNVSITGGYLHVAVEEGEVEALFG